MADDKLRATPAARKLADDLGINLYDVSGSGANGRVHKEDVETYKDTNVVRISPLAKRIAQEHNIAWQEIQGTGHRGKIMKKDVLAFLPENVESDTIKSPAQIEKVEEVPDNVTPYGEIERIPMTPMRKVIAQRMVESYLTAPTFTLNYDVDMTEMLALRKKVLDPIMEATGKSYSAVKKWRISIERLSGYEFKKVKIKVTRKHVKDHYQFTEEEFEKFIKLSKRIDQTKNMTEAVIAIWGDLKSAEERELKQDVAELKNFQAKQKINNKDVNFKLISLEMDLKKLIKLEERLEALEEKQAKGFFSKLKK